MKKPTAHFYPPYEAMPGSERPANVLEEVTIEQLCEQADIDCRVTGRIGPRIVLISGAQPLLLDNAYGIPLDLLPKRRLRPLRILEILAHVFHDYAARECICGRGLFGPPVVSGRPPKHGRALSAAERMRAYRTRLKVVAPARSKRTA